METTVLFVDDEQEVLESIKRAFHRQEGLRVEIAGGAREGIEKLRHYMPGVVVTDMRMPEIDGIGFLKEAQQYRPEAVYMILSGYSEIDKIMTAVNELHVWRYISKPWKKEELRLAISNAVEMFQNREERKTLIKKLKYNNRQLDELNKYLEEKVIERTKQLQDENAILQMLVEDTDTGEILRKICSSLSNQVGTDQVFVYVQFLNKYFGIKKEALPPGNVMNLSEKAVQLKNRVNEENVLVVPLQKNEVVLGTLVIEKPENVSELAVMDMTQSFVSATTLCLIHSKNMLDLPDLDKRIDRFLGEM